MEKEDQVPEDLGVRLGSKSQVVWEAVLKNSKVAIEQSENEIEVQKEIQRLAENKIEEEKRKWRIR